MKKIIALLGLAYVGLGSWELIKRLATIGSSTMLFINNLVGHKTSVASSVNYLLFNFTFEIQGLLFIVAGIGLLFFRNWARIYSVILNVYLIIIFTVVFVMSYALNTVPLTTGFINTVWWIVSRLFFFLCASLYLLQPKIKTQFKQEKGKR